jgi:hypothetical protein
MFGVQLTHPQGIDRTQGRNIPKCLSTGGRWRKRRSLRLDRIFVRVHGLSPKNDTCMILALKNKAGMYWNTCKTIPSPTWPVLRVVHEKGALWSFSFSSETEIWLPLLRNPAKTERSDCTVGHLGNSKRGNHRTYRCRKDDDDRKDAPPCRIYQSSRESDALFFIQFKF